MYVRDITRRLEVLNLQLVSSECGSISQSRWTRCSYEKSTCLTNGRSCDTFQLGVLPTKPIIIRNMEDDSGELDIGPYRAPDTAHIDQVSSYLSKWTK